MTDGAPAVREDLYPAYGELLDELQHITAALDGGNADNLLAAHAAMEAVVRFLQSDPNVVQHQLAMAPAKLLMALEDLRNGAQPKWLVPFRSSPEGDLGGAPRRPTADAVRASFAAALDLLRDASMPIAEGAAWLAGEAARQGLRMPAGKRVGEPILAGTILGWREEINGARAREDKPGLVVAFDKFKSVKTPPGRDVAELLKGPNGLDVAKRLASNRLHSVKGAGL